LQDLIGLAPRPPRAEGALLEESPVPAQLTVNIIAVTRTSLATLAGKERGSARDKIIFAEFTNTDLFIAVFCAL